MAMRLSKSQESSRRQLVPFFRQSPFRTFRQKCQPQIHLEVFVEMFEMEIVEKRGLVADGCNRVRYHDRRCDRKHTLTFMLPFGNDEQRMKCRVSIDFSAIRSPNRVLTPLKSASKIIIFLNLRLGLKFMLPKRRFWKD
jgi:hypothetical protein